jgi:hypothetical protein
MEGFDAPALDAPARLPTGFVSAAEAARPLREPGAQPGAVVLLLEFDVQGAAG